MIRTARLNLIALPPEFLHAWMDRDFQAAESILGAKVPPELATPHDQIFLPMFLERLAEDGTLQQWLMRAMVLRETGVMIGHIGCHTAPGADYLREYSPEAVEFGFEVLPEFRRQGFAHEASLALMDWATNSHGVTEFILSISPHNKASQGLAAKLGFIRIGEHLDEIDGLEDVLERRVFRQPA